jgi:alkylresorcinol/alkylpyrone synthase
MKGGVSLPKVLSVGEAIPPYTVYQSKAKQFVKQMFGQAYSDINRLLQVFENSEIQTRSFMKELEWYTREHSFAEKNNVYIDCSVQLGKEAIRNCLQGSFLREPISYEDIDMIITISSTGLATPTIEARIMNDLPFRTDTKRLPIWGLGCAGGAAGLARAFEYCRQHQFGKVLVLTIEMCSLTFQRNDFSKSNLIGTALFADGVACALVCGDEVVKHSSRTFPSIIGCQSALKKHALNVMGWDIRNEGLFVIFSRDIPSIIEEWLKPHVEQFLHKYHLSIKDIEYFIAHPGGKKVLDAYERTFQIDAKRLDEARKVLTKRGNMSSVTILTVLQKHLEQPIEAGKYGLAFALGPGFSAEMLLLRWE